MNKEYKTSEAKRAYQRKYSARNREREKARSKAWRESGKEDLVSLYYLPEEHYVGITSNVKYRMQSHRRDGKITERYEIIGKFERRVDAHWLETKFHQRGYNGFRKYE